MIQSIEFNSEVVDAMRTEFVHCETLFNEIHNETVIETTRMDIIEINDNLLAALHLKAMESETKRMSYSLKTTDGDGSQLMLNALEPDTQVPIHRHLEASETMICLQGCLDVVFYDLRPNEDCGGPFMGDCGTVLSEGMQTNVFERHRIRLCPQEGKYGVLIPPGIWHSVTVYETSTLIEGGCLSSLLS